MEQQKDFITGVKSMVRALDTAAKNLILYPETNEIRGQSINAVKGFMDAVLIEGSLRLFVGKGQLIFNDEVVYQDKSADHGFVSPLFRDGIHSIEFIEGIPLEEIEVFINLLNKLKVLPDETDDDIVTAMWESDFKFIKYDTADEFWETDDSIDIASLKVASAADFRPTNSESSDDRLQQMPGEAEAQRTESLSTLFNSLSDPEGTEAMDSQFPDNNNRAGDSSKPASPNSPTTYTIAQWQRMLAFSDDEKQHIQDMIEAERNRNIIADSLEILINLMYCRPDHPDNSQVLSFLVDEVREALSKADFEDVQKCVLAIMSFSQSGMPPLARLASEFSRQMANEDTLKALALSWENPDELTEDYYKNAYQFLMSLPPDSAASMIPLMGESKNAKITGMLSWVIAYKAAYASIDLTPLLNKLRPDLLTDLINIFRSPQLPFPTIIMVNLARNPISSEVRQAAAEALIENDPGQIKVLFPLVKDANPAVSRMALQYLGRTRNKQAESHLVNHLKNIMEGEDDRPPDHIMQCYQALGLCASQNSLPFLEQALFRKSLKALLGMDEDYHRQGAATALLLMPPETGGKALVEKACASPFKSIREACQLAMNKVAQGIN